MSNSQRFTDFHILLAEIDRIQATTAEQAQREIRAILRQFAGASIYFPHAYLTQPERTEYAAKLLARGHPAPLVRKRLQAAYGLSRSHAYRITHSAQNTPQNNPQNP